MLSIVVARGSTSHLLSGDGLISRKYPGYNKHILSHNDWLKYATDAQIRNIDNLFLKLFGGQYKFGNNNYQKRFIN